MTETATGPALVVSDEEVLAKAASISDAQLLADIETTEREIAEVRRCADAYDVLARNHWTPAERRMSEFRADNARDQAERGERLLAHIRRVARLRNLLPSIAEEIMRREG